MLSLNVTLRKHIRRLYWKLQETLLTIGSKNVEFDLLGKYAEEGKAAGFNSQRGQDYFIATKIFKNQRDGFFVDIGANHPTLDNNTYSFEKKLGWKGLSIDAQNRYERVWNEHRNTPLVISLVSDTSGQRLTFDVVESASWENMLSGISAAKNAKVKKDLYSRSHVLQKEMVTSSLSEILDKFSNPKIDFLSIDVEGHELQVLSGIDFSKIDIRCICLENDTSCKRIRRHLTSKGYRLVANLLGDDIYLRNDA